MSDRWDQAYSVAKELPAVCYGLLNYRHLLPNKGVGLDLACGLGQNAIFLSKHGLSMHGWDYSKVGLEQMKQHCQKQGVNVQMHPIDLESETWPKLSFDLICVNAFLARQLCPQIVSALKPGGTLVYQTFNTVHELDGQCLSKPSRSEFLLERYELLSLFSELEVLVYEDYQNTAKYDDALAGKALLMGQKKFKPAM